MAAARTEPAERLLNLVIALAASPRKVTKEQIRSTVAGYGDAANEAAFERMFERDKDELRALGVPIVTETDPFFDDDIGYRIDLDAYGMDDVDFSPAELAVLAVAARLWQDAALSGPASRGLTKLRALGMPVDVLSVMGVAARMSPADESFDTILDAIDRRQAVTFSYRARSAQQASVRTVEPWRLAANHGVWYLVGHDRDRRAPRVFRLSRMEGKVKRTSRYGAFEIPADVDAQELLAGTPSEPPMSMCLLVREGRGHAWRDRGTPVDLDVVFDGFDSLVVDVSAPRSWLVGELAAHADDVVVVAPPSLRSAVLDHLTASHWGQGDEDG